MSNENLQYNAYYGNNLCNLLANSIVENIKSSDPKLYINISVTNVNSFFMVCGETEYKEQINFTSLFTDVMDLIPKPMQTMVKVFDLVVYGVERKKETILYKETFLKYSKNLKENYKDIKLLDSLNSSGLFCNLQHFDKKTFIQIISNDNGVDNPNGFESMDLTNKVFKSEDIYGKDLYSVKYIYMLFRYIAYTLFESNLCKNVELLINTNASIHDISHETIGFSVNSDSLIANKEWVESLILDIFTFEPEKVIQELNLDTYDFSKEIILKEDTYPWMLRDKLKDIVLV